MAVFPGGVKSFTTKVDEEDFVMASHVNDLQDEVMAIETELRKTSSGSSVVNHGSLNGLENDDHPQYLKATAKAVDADKLDGIDSTGFVKSTGNESIGGVKTFTSLPLLPGSDPTSDNQPTRKAYVDAMGTTKVGLTGNQSISGTKTFTAWVVLPSGTPSLGTHAAPKSYVDSQLDTAVKLTGNQSIGGTKTFTAFPITPSSAPTSDYHVANKKYVDDNAGGASGKMVLVPPSPIFTGAGEKPEGVYKITVSNHGVPITAKAVLLRAAPMWTTILSNSYLALRAQEISPTGDENQIVVRPQVTGAYFDTQGWCSVNANGEFWYQISGGNAGNWSFLGIIGYLT